MSTPRKKRLNILDLPSLESDTTFIDPANSSRIAAWDGRLLSQKRIWIGQNFDSASERPANLFKRMIEFFRHHPHHGIRVRSFELSAAMELESYGLIRQLTNSLDGSLTDLWGATTRLKSAVLAQPPYIPPTHTHQFELPTISMYLY